MNSYAFISIIALYSYVFFMLAFLTAKKNRLIWDFIWVLFLMVLWTGGSLLMRGRMWPSYELWYHVSLTGIWLLPYAYYCFIRDFAGAQRKGSQKIWLLLLAAGTAFNLETGFFF